jgi:hypothetical protein
VSHGAALQPPVRKHLALASGEGSHAGAPRASPQPPAVEAPPPRSTPSLTVERRGGHARPAAGAAARPTRGAAALPSGAASPAAARKLASRAPARDTEHSRRVSARAQTACTRRTTHDMRVGSAAVVPTRSSGGWPDGVVSTKHTRARARAQRERLLTAISARALGGPVEDGRAGQFCQLGGAPGIVERGDRVAHRAWTASPSGEPRVPAVPCAHPCCAL